MSYGVILAAASYISDGNFAGADFIYYDVMGVSTTGIRRFGLGSYHLLPQRLFMSTISVCKANLTKAHSALEATKGKIPQNLIDPFNSKTIPPADELQRLDERQDAIRTHLSNMRAALRTVRERHQAFLDFINKSTDPENDNAAYMDYMQQSKIEDATVAADNLIHVLHTNLEEACARLERLRSSIAPNQQQEHDRSQHELDVETTPQSRDYQRTQAHYPQTTLRDTTNNTSDNHYTSLGNQHAANQPTIQLGKLTLEPFTGDITQFQRFWRAFEVAVHNDSSISATYKFLYLQSLLKGEAQIVLQDMDPDECNYYELMSEPRALTSQLPVSQLADAAQGNTTNSCADISHAMKGSAVVPVGTTATGRADTTTNATGVTIVTIKGQIFIKKSLTGEIQTQELHRQ
ncbi:hypothetical protein OSTOST_16081 [Ostertagia ostertagi]